MASHVPKIFVSYASEDVAAGLRVADALSTAGLDPWIDRLKLLGGEDWDLAINRAIRQADFVLVLLSEKSVSKRGYIQREVKVALDLWKEKLDEDVYLIPVRIAPCEVPESLRRFHRIDLFQPDGIDRLLASIQAGMRRRLTADPLPDLQLENVTLKDSWLAPVACTGEVSFPRIRGGQGGDPGIERANAAFCRTATAPFEDFMSEEASRHGEILNDELPTESSIYIAWSCTLLAEDVISVQFSRHLYSAGAAHGSQGFMHCNFVLSPFRELKLVDLLPVEAVQLTRQWVRAELSARLNPEREDSTDDWIARGTEDPNTYGFNILPDRLIFLWAPYQVASYADGPQIAEISIDRLLPFLPANSLLRRSRSNSGLQQTWASRSVSPRS